MVVNCTIVSPNPTLTLPLNYLGGLPLGCTIPNPIYFLYQVRVVVILPSQFHIQLRNLGILIHLKSLQSLRPEGGSMLIELISTLPQTPKAPIQQICIHLLVLHPLPPLPRIPRWDSRLQGMQFLPRIHQHPSLVLALEPHFFHLSPLVQIIAATEIGDRSPLEGEEAAEVLLAISPLSPLRLIRHLVLSFSYNPLWTDEEHGRLDLLQPLKIRPHCRCFLDIRGISTRVQSLHMGTPIDPRVVLLRRL